MSKIQDFWEVYQALGSDLTDPRKFNLKGISRTELALILDIKPDTLLTLIQLISYPKPFIMEGIMSGIISIKDARLQCADGNLDQRDVGLCSDGRCHIHLPGMYRCLDCGKEYENDEYCPVCGSSDKVPN